MADTEDYEDDLFADLYEGDEAPSKPAQPPSAAPEPAASNTYEAHESVEEVMPDQQHMNGTTNAAMTNEENEDRMQGGWEATGNQHYDGGPVENDDNYGPVGIKEDG